MKYFRWLSYEVEHSNEQKEVWNLTFQNPQINEWDFMSGKYVDEVEILTVYYDTESEHTDYPFGPGLLPVYSSRLKSLIDGLGINEIQYIPLRIKHKHSDKEVYGYFLANYLSVIDCLNREKSIYQIYTKENLLYWEQRPYMLGTFHYVNNAILDVDKIGDARIFRLWGWEVMIIVREDVKQAIEEAGITGGGFLELQVI
jgi:hypothetical protein